jgi:hypothetical protein
MGYLNSAYGLKPTLVVTHHASLATDMVDGQVWICPDLGCKYQLASVEEVHQVIATAAASVMPEKVTSTTAPASGVDLVTTAIDLNGVAAQTVTTKTLTTTYADLLFNPGDRIVLDYSGDPTGCINSVIQFVLVPVEAGL